MQSWKTAHSVKSHTANNWLYGKNIVGANSKLLRLCNQSSNKNEN